ncbi:MAG: hypothetical protein A2231_08990 [Candidatus Firestonebacteria bacterium RIFOXYA2_FULL_40_8]|nr:MAG: hypothetical protein A2231_08990 [Candidatus Firestonebacteria bacterium RIFOXYA2_FULL_40_8]
MSQTPKQVIKNHMNFSWPDRIGMNFSNVMDHPDSWSDLKVIWPKPKGWERKTWKDEKFKYYDDPWGNVWYTIEKENERGEVFKPALQNWSDLKNYKAPDYTTSLQFDELKKLKKEDKDTHYLVIGLPGFVFSASRYLRKMEVYLEDLALERENIDKLHAIVADVLEGIIIKAAECGADGICFGEDWGIQDRTLISPSMFDDIFLPHHKRLFKAARQRGLSVEMHSCGNNWAILPSLVEAGVSAFQFDQPNLYGLEKLAKYLQENKVCLKSPVDIQKILPTGDKKLIQDNARAMAKLFCGSKGGFIAENYGDLKGIGVDPEWNKWGYEAFLEFCK